jgi:hypothetical protein
VAYGTSGRMIAQSGRLQIAGREPFEGADQRLSALSGITWLWCGEHTLSLLPPWSRAEHF